jgi:signal transduction histidine kinase/ligand-binding sensor domain-containing protein/DNA-binding response OmpR family regulator
MDDCRFKMLLISLLMGFTVMQAAEPLSFKTYNASDGLSDNTVLCGLRDSYGFLWLGTPNGLNCFDGTNNRVYRNMVDENVTFENNIIISLMEHNGDIWFGGSFGLYIYHRALNSFTRFNAATKYGVVISSMVQKIMTARNGLIWICTMGQGVFVYNPKTRALMQISRYGGFISDICQSDDGLIYMASIKGALLVFKPNGTFLRSYSITNFVTDKNKLCVQHAGNEIWCGTDAGLYHLNRQTGTMEKHEAPVWLGSINSIVSYSQHRLLLGTTQGLYSYDLYTRIFTRVDGEGAIPGLSDPVINDLLLDRDGTLWVMTSMGGVNSLAQTQNLFDFQTLPTQKPNQKVIAQTFCEVGNGDLWIGTSVGLYYYDHTTKVTKLFAGGQFPYNVSSLLLDGDSLWIGTQSAGVRVYNTKTHGVKAYTYSPDKPYTVGSNDINCIYKSRKGTIFIASSWGICRFDRAHGRFMVFPALSSMTEFVDIAEDTRGDIWVASSNRGAYCYTVSKDSWTPYTFDRNDDHSLSSNSLVSIFRDSRGQMWFATKGGGLCRYNAKNNNFDRFDSDDNTVYSLQEDNEHFLWVQSDLGVMKINIRTDSIVHVADNNDLVYGQLLARSSYFTHRGTLLFGTIGGYYYFKPSLLRRQGISAPVYITSISLPYRSSSQKEIQSLGLDRPLYMLKEIELPYRDNIFTLHFSVPHFTKSGRVIYEYMLKGVDKQWARGAGNAMATYANVSPGEYEFMLRVAGSDNTNISRLTIVILPPWYRTIWAYLLYVVLLAATCYYIYTRVKQSIRLKYISRMNHYREEQEKRMFQSKINFFVNLVHEIRTPLSLISLPLERMQQQKRTDEDKRYLDIIHKNMNYLLGITNQLLDFQKVENSTLNLNKRNSSIKQLLQDTYNQFEGYIDAKGKDFQLQLPEEDVITAIDRDRMHKILMNLMSNALKYTRSKIVISMKADEQFVHVMVTDDGPGIPDAEKEKIFETFYQAQNDRIAAALGTGIGLSYSRMLAKAHDGDLKVEDAEGGGSCFVLTLPIVTVEANQENESAKNEEIRKIVEDTFVTDEPSSTSRNFNILLVEDNVDLLSMTSDSLQKWYHVLKASDGVEALRVLNNNEVDVIVSDWMMPNMDGNEFCKKVKENLDYSHIPFILLTAKTTLEAKVEGMNSGADIYLEKPFAIQQLHKQIENLLRLRQRFYERMSALKGEVDTIAPNEFGMSQQDLQLVERIQKLLNENIGDETFSIDSLASELNMSRSSFYRKLKGLTGMTPVDFMKTQRMNRAVDLLLKGNPIQDVSVQVGFTSASYFTKCFKQQFGVLPKDYTGQEPKGKK